MSRTQTLLGIFAHPDDETFGPGATLARYADHGAHVHVIIATDGIAGSVEDPAHVQDHDTLAQARSAELANAAVALKVRSIWSMRYRDSGMRDTPDNDHADALIQQPLSVLIHDVLDYIRRLKPQVILTHGPFGGYGHPDHIRVCEAVTAAFHIAHRDADGPQKLYFTAYDKRYMKWTISEMRKEGIDPENIGRNADIDLVEISGWESPISARVDVRDYVAQKEKASRAHASQYSGGPIFLRFLPDDARNELAATDVFTLAFPHRAGQTECDLFDGVQ